MVIDYTCLLIKLKGVFPFFFFGKTEVGKSALLIFSDTTAEWLIQHNLLFLIHLCCELSCKNVSFFFKILRQFEMFGRRWGKFVLSRPGVERALLKVAGEPDGQGGHIALPKDQPQAIVKCGAPDGPAWGGARLAPWTPWALVRAVQPAGLQPPPAHAHPGPDPPLRRGHPDYHGPVGGVMELSVFFSPLLVYHWQIVKEVN